MKSQQQDLALLLLRIGTAGLMIPHGWSKLNRLIDGLSSEEGVAFYNWLGIGEMPSLILTIIGELIAPLAVLLGWKCRWGAGLIAFTMAVAAFMVHWSDPLADKEHALLFFFPACALVLMGPGRWSLDRM